jgi:dihydropyrimidine dehydrogenase (NAD+) subunit PreA
MTSDGQDVTAPVSARAGAPATPAVPGTRREAAGLFRGPDGAFDPQGARVEAARCLFCFEAPCVAACPTHIDVPGFIRRIAVDDPFAAARTILAANPLGGTCARVCPVERLCEGACVRTHLDGPIAIGLLQRFAVDALHESGAPFFAPGPGVEAHVAVVGAGPAGLACAVELRRAGIRVTVYEARERAGGLPVSAIVPWRHGREATAAEVSEIERVGVEIRTGERIGADLTVDDLLATHDAVFLGPGLGRGRRLGIPGEDLDGVLDALDVLEAVVDDTIDGPRIGRRVGVIGGGSTAFDAAAAAARLGCDEVTLFYRRTEAEAPVHPHALDLARSLGVRLRWLAAPVEVVGHDGRVRSVRFEEMRLGEPGPDGRRIPAPVAGDSFEAPLDTLIVAIGQGPVADLLDEAGVARDGGWIAVDPSSGRTSHPRIWAGGDAVNGGHEVVDAVEGGKVAARSIAAAVADGLIASKGAGTSGAASKVRVEPVPSGAREPVSAMDLSVDFAGIRSPNPFWLASGPPTNTGEMVARAFEAGWGGAVWKTVGEPIVNVTSRLGALDLADRRMAGISNIELISDRPIETNLAEIREVKRRFPDRAVVVSLMVESNAAAWHDIVRRVNDTGADGIELNCGCPHGMAERGMGAAVGQVPDYLRMIVEWAKEASEVPVLVKLTPNVTDITAAARAAREGGADGIALINTINSLVGVELDTWEPRPAVRGRGTHGGYSGPAVKPIALNMVAACARDPRVGLPISGVGGIDDWRDAVQFLLLGATTVQVCTAVMHHGYRIVEDLVDGLADHLRARGLSSPADLVGRVLPAIGDWGQLDLDYRLVARVDPARCIGCGLCYVACLDGAHQAIRLDRPTGRAVPVVDDDACVGCRLCEHVCPVEGCVTMAEVEARAPSHAGT